MTKIEIIEELFDNGYYKDPKTRAVEINSNGKQIGCYYKTNDNRRCAVGKTLLEDKKILNYNGSVISLITDFSVDLNSIQKKSYRGHDTVFWEELQSLHDGNYFWDKDGLSHDGKGELQYLKNKYKNENN